MINRAELKNFGPIKELDWQNLGKINLIIGNNGCGKSFLLKALYSAVRTIEEYKRADSPDFQNIDDILKNKLWWTFQPEKFGDLVNKSDDSNLSLKLILNNQLFNYSFGKEDALKPICLENQVAPRSDNSVYLPAKEVLTLFEMILSSRDNNKKFGFDDTYLDLTKALIGQYYPSEKLLDRISNFQKKRANFLNRLSELEKTVKNALEIQDLDSEHKKNISSDLADLKLELNDFEELDKLKIVHKEFQECRNKLDKILGGKIDYDNELNRWYFEQGNQKFSVGVMAEGIKKIAILDTLLGNGFLSEKSIVFIDEPEANLHPQAISQLLDIIAILAKQGIQFFLASHSYFVIKKLFLIAQEQQMSIPVLSYQNNEWVQSDLKKDLPDNPIIDESIKLYEQQLDLSDC